MRALFYLSSFCRKSSSVHGFIAQCGFRGYLFRSSANKRARRRSATARLRLYIDYVLESRCVIMRGFWSVQAHLASSVETAPMEHGAGDRGVPATVVVGGGCEAARGAKSPWKSRAGEVLEMTVVVGPFSPLTLPPGTSILAKTRVTAAGTSFSASAPQGGAFLISR